MEQSTKRKRQRNRNRLAAGVGPTGGAVLRIRWIMTATAVCMGRVTGGVRLARPQCSYAPLSNDASLMIDGTPQAESVSEECPRLSTDLTEWPLNVGVDWNGDSMIAGRYHGV